MIQTDEQLRKIIKEVLQATPIIDVHTHLYPESFKNMLLWGIDSLLTYHYLVAEYFRYHPGSYRRFFALSPVQQADLIWEELFLKRSPVSEAQKGVLTVLSTLGLDPKSNSLDPYRKYFHSLSLSEQIDTVFTITNLDYVVMTNDPFDPQERGFWQAGGGGDPRFKAALRIDPLLFAYKSALQSVQAQGYGVEERLSANTLSEIRRFLRDWILKTKALYVAVSLPASFSLAADFRVARIIKECVLPVCRELGIPLALMVGVKRRVNKDLGLAGDSLGKAAIGEIENLAAQFPQNKFLVTMLSRENQHELAVTARKFRNVLPFGCWWFLNSPSLIREITGLRLELLGLSFIPQHSDARVLEQLIYKWQHSKAILAEVLWEKYRGLISTGWSLTQDEITRDLRILLRGNFLDFLGADL